MTAATHTHVHGFSRPLRSIQAATKSTVFLLKLLPMLPSKPLNRVTPTPIVERLTYPTAFGNAEGDLYRPDTAGPHPGVVVCLGVVPFDVDHPQVPRLGEALARSGFAALLYWSPAMRDLWLDPADSENVALAYQALLEQPFIDPERSGLIGTCVGGAFVLLAAAQPLIRDHLSFVAAFAPYASMWTLAQDIATCSRLTGDVRVPWPVDQLTRKVYLKSVTSTLDPDEGGLLRQAFGSQTGRVDQRALSPDGQAVYRLLSAQGREEVEAALRSLPDAMRQRLAAMSPEEYLNDIDAPHIIIGHDRDDLVIPVGESHRLQRALAGRPGFHYTEFGMFQHADPTKRKLSPLRLAWELGKFYGYLYPIFRCAVSR